jgi:hypothetical protein
MHTNEDRWFGLFGSFGLFGLFGAQVFDKAGDDSPHFVGLRVNRLKCVFG